MKENRKLEISIGILSLLIFVFGILSIVYIIEEADYLSKIIGNENDIYRGAFFQLVMAIIYIAIAYLFYPIIKKYSGKIALFFVGLRFTAVAFHIIGVVLLILFIPIGQIYVQAGSIVTPYLQTIAELLRLGRDLLNHAGMMFVYVLGSLTLYFVMFKTKLVPKWLSALGVFGCIMTIAASLLYMFGIIKIVTPIYMALNAPLALQELFLAFYILIKGFSYKDLPSKSTTKESF